MNVTYQPTSDELRAVWRETGLWRDGHTFEHDSQVPVVHKALCNAVIARHKSNSLPQQGNLI